MAVISAVVPVYKVEAYLPECVDSLLAQTFRDIEIILVDDGSPDRCPTICDTYAKKDSRIRVIHQKNGGLSRARNAGAAAASGKYICFVDSDDLVMPTYCEALLDALQNSECDFSVCRACRFQDGARPAPSAGSREVRVIPNTELLRLQFDRKSEFGVWNKLYPRELFDTLRFMPGKLHEDVIFSADLVKNLHWGVAVVDQELYLYRQRDGGIVSTQSLRCSPDRIFAGEYLLNAVKATCPELTKEALHYAVSYPFTFADPIYVHRTFRQNRQFFRSLQTYLKKHISEYTQNSIFPKIQTSRMALFAKSPFLYGFNAYGRLLRVYLYRLFRKDAYKTGHGI